MDKRTYIDEKKIDCNIYIIHIYILAYMNDILVTLETTLMLIKPEFKYTKSLKIRCRESTLSLDF